MADEEILQSIREAIGDFREGARLQNEEGQRLARRTAQIVRWSFIGMVLLGIGLSALLFLLTRSLLDTTEQIQGIHDYTRSMSQDLQSVRGEMVQIRGEMSVIAGHMGSIDGEMGKMRQRVAEIRERVAGLESNVGVISREFQVMNGQLNGIGQSVGRMTRDMNEMSTPMRMMPWR